MVYVHWVLRLLLLLVLLLAALPFALGGLYKHLSPSRDSSSVANRISTSRSLSSWLNGYSSDSLSAINWVDVCCSINYWRVAIWCKMSKIIKENISLLQWERLWCVLKIWIIQRFSIPKSEQMIFNPRIYITYILIVTKYFETLLLIIIKRYVCTVCIFGGWTHKIFNIYNNFSGCIYNLPQCILYFRISGINL